MLLVNVFVPEFLLSYRNKISIYSYFKSRQFAHCMWDFNTWLLLFPASGAFKWDRVFRGRAQCDRRPPPSGPAHARGSAHLLWPAMEPHHLDASFTGTQQTVSHVQRKADTVGLCWRVYQTVWGATARFLCADVTVWAFIYKNIVGDCRSCWMLYWVLIVARVLPRLHQAEVIKWPFWRMSHNCWLY